MFRYAILCSLPDGSTLPMREAVTLRAAMRKTEKFAKVQGGYFFVFDRLSQSVVYVYAQPTATEARSPLVEKSMFRFELTDGW